LNFEILGGQNLVRLTGFEKKSNFNEKSEGVGTRRRGFGDAGGKPGSKEEQTRTPKSSAATSGQPSEIVPRRKLWEKKRINPRKRHIPQSEILQSGQKKLGGRKTRGGLRAGQGRSWSKTRGQKRRAQSHARR